MNRDINYQYFPSVLRALPKGIRVLDYGCGGGDTVALLRAEGINAVGCDTFYGGNGHQGDARESLIAERVRAGLVIEVPETGDLPFPPHSFDVILSNQVLEHVTDLPATLARMEKVLAPDGLMLHHFPDRGVWREGHMGVAFAHWFPKGKNRGTLRWWYVYLFRRLGLGYHKAAHPSAAEWTDHWLDYLDRWTAYRPYAEIRRAFDQHFRVAHRELRYVTFRAQSKPLIRRLANLLILRPLARWLFGKLAFRCFELRFTPEQREIVASQQYIHRKREAFANGHAMSP